MTPTPCASDAGADRAISIERFVWRGVTIELVFEADWHGAVARGLAFPSAHLEVRSRDPGGAPLPITESGYRSHFIDCGVVEAAGGPVPYATAWLDEAANSPKWRQSEARGRQLDLFEPP